jgi:hypothetical protein
MIDLIEARSVTAGDRVKHPVSMGRFRKVDRASKLRSRMAQTSIAHGDRPHVLRTPSSCNGQSNGMTRARFPRWSWPIGLRINCHCDSYIAFYLALFVPGCYSDSNKSSEPKENTMIVISKQTKTNQLLEIEVTDQGRCIVHVAGKVIKCVRCEGPEFADFTAKGMGQGYVVNGVSFVTVEEGETLAAAIKDACQAAKANREAEAAAQKAATKQVYIEQGGVELMYHEYSTGYPEYYLIYGSVRERVYPDLTLIPQRDFDSEHMAGHSWSLDLVEHAALADAPTVEPVVEYIKDAALTGTPEGVDAIRAAENDYAKAEAAYERAYEREQYAALPSSKDLDAVIAAHPRAALYLQCEGQSQASNDNNATAGRKALQLLVDGGSEVDVKAVSKNWH